MENVEETATTVVTETHSILDKISIESLLGYVEKYGLPVLYALFIYLVGSWGIKKITKMMNKVMTKNHYDESLQVFLFNLVTWALKIFLIIICQFKYSSYICTLNLRKKCAYFKSRKHHHLD